MQQLQRRTRSTMAASGAGLGLLLASIGGAAADPVQLSGSLSDAGASFTSSQLDTLGTTVGTFSETVNGDSFTGVSLWSLLGGTASGSSNVVVNTSLKNPILSDYVMASGANGSESLISLGEIDPFFGGTAAQPIIVAYQQGTNLLSTPELIVPQGSGRDIVNLNSLQVAGVTPVAQLSNVPPTTQFTLSGAVSTPGTYTLSTLQSLPQATRTVTFLSGHTSTTSTYTGAQFFALLAAAGISQDNILTSYVVATGNDHYDVLFSLAELDPAFGASTDDMLAYSDTSGDFGPTGADGLAMVIIPGDNHGGRFVSTLASLDVVNVPEPTSGLLLLGGLAGMACWRRRAAGA